jgi:hypothetical protein
VDRLEARDRLLPLVLLDIEVGGPEAGDRPPLAIEDDDVEAHELYACGEHRGLGRWGLAGGGRQDEHEGDESAGHRETRRARRERGLHGLACLSSGATRWKAV